MAHGNRMLTSPTMSRDHKRSSGDPNTLKVQYACRNSWRYHIFIFIIKSYSMYTKRKSAKKKGKTINY